MQATNDPAAEIYGASITRPRRNGIGGRVVGQAADRTACTVNHIDFCLSGLVGLEGDPLPIRRPARRRGTARIGKSEPTQVGPIAGGHPDVGATGPRRVKGDIPAVRRVLRVHVGMRRGQERDRGGVRIG